VLHFQRGHDPRQVTFSLLRGTFQLLNTPPQRIVDESAGLASAFRDAPLMIKLGGVAGGL
jgi:hypothetical protein